MTDADPQARPGQIVILNGVPRASKSSIAAMIQETFDGPWMNLGVDVARQITPPRYQPGVGLRPGEQGHEAAPFVPLFYAALYESIAAHSRAGLMSWSTSATTTPRFSPTARDGSRRCLCSSSESAARST